MIEINHGAPKQYVGRIWAAMGWPAMPDADMNRLIPSFPLRKLRHGHGKGLLPSGVYEETFHDILDGNADWGVINIFDRMGHDRDSPADMRRAIKAAHDRMQMLYGAADETNYSAMGELVDDFLRASGVP